MQDYNILNKCLPAHRGTQLADNDKCYVTPAILSRDFDARL